MPLVSFPPSTCMPYNYFLAFSDVPVSTIVNNTLNHKPFTGILRNCPRATVSRSRICRRAVGFLDLLLFLSLPGGLDNCCFYYLPLFLPLKIDVSKHCHTNNYYNSNATAYESNPDLLPLKYYKKRK